MIAAALLQPAGARADLAPALGECAEVRFIGVKGSGETSEYGREMGELSASLVLTMPRWVNFESSAVQYPAYSVSKLFEFPEGPIEYGEGVEQGDEALRTMLDELEVECPDEREILGGYSSGAIVLHDILEEAQSSNHWRSHIVGVHLLADPRREGSDVATLHAGGASSSTNGITAWDKLNVTDLQPPGAIPQPFQNMTKSWCKGKDVICSTTPGSLASAGLDKLLGETGIHSEYGAAILPNLFRDEAQRLAEPFVDRFPPSVQILPTTATGWPVNDDLKDGFDGPVKFAGIAPPIPGLKLSKAGLLSGSVPATGRYESMVTAVTTKGGTTEFPVILEVVEPFEMVPFELEPVEFPPMPVHQPVNAPIPSVPSHAVVTLEPGDEMPEGLHLTAAGKLHGRPEVVGDTNIGVRVAQPDGVLRRFELDLRVVNPAQPVSVSADGTFANGEVTEGVVLDDTHVAFVSTADNLGADNPNQASLVYLKNLTTGLLSYWRPSEEDRVCGIATDPAKANLYIATSRLEEDPSEPGEFRERIDVRVLQIDSHTYGAGEVAANLVTTFTGPCGGRLPVAALANGKLAVISPYRLDTVGEPYDSAEPPNRLYLWHGGAFTRVDNPIEDGAAWSSASFADVGSDGTLLIVGERLKSGVVKHIGELEAGYFSLDPNGTWERIDLDATGVPTAMSPPRLFGGGVVYGRERVVPLVRRATKPLVIRAPEGELRFKQLQPSDSVPFGAPRLNAFGITPLTSDSYAAACATFNGRHPLRTEPSTVFYEDVEIPSCLASPSGGGADPFEEAGATKMLVAGPVNGVRELLVAAVP